MSYMQSSAENKFPAIEALETLPLPAVQGTYTFIKNTNLYILLCAHNQGTKLEMHEYGFLNICQQ